MSCRIAIHHDFVRHKNGERQSFSERWIERSHERGWETVDVDAMAPSFFEDVRRCDGLMWRFGYGALSLQLAKRLLQAVEQGLGLPVFPSHATAWHFEDKIAQTYLLEAAGIDTPKTWVFWREEDALRFSRDATYPFVVKLSSGIQSNNVKLVKSPDEATALIRRMFKAGVVTLYSASRIPTLLQGYDQGLRILAGKSLPRQLQYGYFYVQEFLPDNAFDTRVTVIGNRAFGFRRHNRPGDFRASGSGRLDWDVSQVDLRFVRLAYTIARRFHMQSVAIDGLQRGGTPVVGEISYTYASWAVRDCLGHWVLDGDPQTGTLTWIDGKMRPEDAIFDDFAPLVEARGAARAGHSQEPRR